MSRLVVLWLCAAVVLLSSMAGSSAEDVIVLTPENFDLEVAQSKGALVAFYAPWCEYSKRLAPEYEKLGTTLKRTENVLIGKVDCHQYASLCFKYRISGYPTIRWFPAGSQVSKNYFGDRTVDALAEFVNTEAGTRAKLSTPASDVVELTPANFDSVVLDKTKDVLVNFYAPYAWCSSCKSLAPVYEEVATFFKKESAVVVAKCDAAAHRELRERYHIIGFPTIKFFPKDKYEVVDYDGDRGVEDLFDFLARRAGTRWILSRGHADIPKKQAVTNPTPYVGYAFESRVSLELPRVFSICSVKHLHCDTGSGSGQVSIVEFLQS